MKTLRLLPALLLLAFSVHAPRAQDAGQPKAETYNFFIFYMGARIGWTKANVTLEKLDGRQVRHEHEESWLQIKRSFDSHKFTTTSVTDSWYETDGTEVKRVDVTKNGSQTTKLETVCGKDAFTITETIDDGTPSVTTLKRGDKTIYDDLRAWHVLQESKKLKAGESLKFWSVDDDSAALVQQTWTVGGKEKRKLSDKSVVEGWEIRGVKGGRARTILMGDDDEPLVFETSGGFRIERADKIPDPFEPERVTMRTTMTSNVAVRDFEQLTELDIHFAYEHDDGNGVPPIVDSNAYHDVVKYDKGYAIRMKSRRLKRDFKSPAYPLTDIPEDVKKYLKPTAMCQSDDEVLIAAAQSQIKHKKNAVSVARALMRFANRHLRDASGNTGAASARQAYDEGTGDCTEHAALFVALARAAGLPARNVGGIVYAYMAMAGKAIFGYHAWAEVWLGQWVPVDATVDDLGTAARYIMFEYDEPGETYGHARSSRCMRHDIHPIVDGYKLADGTTWRRQGAPTFDWDKQEKAGK